MRTLSDRALRTQLGIPRRRLAPLAGVSSPTMALYEADPACVGDDIRERCERTYNALRDAIAKMPCGVKLLKAG